MKQEWLQYLQEIGVAEILFDNIDKKIQEVSSIFNTDIQEIFVSNNRTEQEVVYTSLWLFAENKAYECKSFISKEDYDVLVFENKVSYVNITKSNFSDFDNPSQDSSINVVCYIDTSNLSCTFNAVGINSKYLLKLIKEKYLRNLI